MGHTVKKGISRGARSKILYFARKMPQIRAVFMQFNQYIIKNHDRRWHGFLLRIFTKHLIILQGFAIIVSESIFYFAVAQRAAGSGIAEML